MAVIVLLLSFFGTKAMVRKVVSAELSSAAKATAAAEAASELVKEVAKGVREDTVNRRRQL